MTPSNSPENGKKRLLRVTAGNLRQSHLYVNGHYDFFPPDCVGGPKRSAASRTIEIHLDGLNEAVTTDIGRDARTGKPRGFFRARGWVRRFFAHHGVRPGTLLALERLSERAYRLSVQPSEQEVRLECAEFFAGIGLVRLALERQRWRVVFANDIDPKKAEMYRHNWPNDDHLVVGDIHALKADEVPSCTLFTAAFPYDDLSCLDHRLIDWLRPCGNDRREIGRIGYLGPRRSTTCARSESATSWQRRMSSITRSHKDQ